MHREPATGGLHFGEWAAELVGTAHPRVRCAVERHVIFHPGSVFLRVDPL